MSDRRDGHGDRLRQRFINLYSDPTNGGSIEMTASAVTVALGGQISADGGGLARGPAPIRRATTGGGLGNISGGGGGYGGVGGQGNPSGHGNNFGGPTYGSVVAPYLYAGSGGGSGIGAGGGGVAGGLIWIAAPQVTVNGTLTPAETQETAMRAAAPAAASTLTVA